MPALLRAGPLLGLCLPFFAAFAPRAAAAGFPFSLHPERARYLLGEPVYLRIDASGGRPPALEENAMGLVIRDPSGAERVYRPPLRLRVGPALPPLAVAGPAAVSRFARLVSEGGGWAFPRPGRYTLRLRARSASGGRDARAGLSLEGEALSDTAGIEVAEPVAPEDRRAFALLSRAPGECALAIYLEGGDHLRAAMAILNEVASFPNAYARTAAFVLGSAWAQDFAARGGGIPRRLDLARALGLAQWDRSSGAYVPLRTAFRLRGAIAIQSGRDPLDPALAAARARLREFEDSLTAGERALLASF